MFSMLFDFFLANTQATESSRIRYSGCLPAPAQRKGRQDGSINAIEKVSSPEGMIWF